jgi:hypothetical protein
LSKGADPNKIDKNGNSAIHYLVANFASNNNSSNSKESKNIFDVLLAYGANPNLCNK